MKTITIIVIIALIHFAAWALVRINKGERETKDADR